MYIRNNTMRSVWAVILGLAFMFSGAVSQAATCSFGSLNGTASTCTVTGADFDVQYDLSAVGLYGDARIVGSNILFFPTGFNATSTNGAGVINTASTVSFDLIMTNPGLAIDELHLLERGRYQLDGAGASVNHAGNLDVFDLTNFDSLADNITANGVLNINDNAVNNWTANGDIDLTASAFHFSPTLSANIQITNSLSATTLANGDFAMIEKILGQQVVILGVNESPPLPSVPVPPAVFLFGSGLIGLVGLARRKV